MPPRPQRGTVTASNNGIRSWRSRSLRCKSVIRVLPSSGRVADLHRLPHTKDPFTQQNVTCQFGSIHSVLQCQRALLRISEQTDTKVIVTGTQI